MIIQCEFHGYDKFGCPGCKKSDKEITKDLIKQGKLTYIISAWHGDGRYSIGNAVGCKTYKSQGIAERVANRMNGESPTGNYVVRLVLTA